MKLSVLSTMLLFVLAPAVGRTQDLESSFKSLQDAQAKNDAAAVKKLAAETCALARTAAAEPAPQAQDEKDAWTKRVAYARDIETNTEYALFAVAAQAPPATAVDLLGTLVEQNPKSKYLDEGYATYLYDLSQAGQTAKIPAIAEKGLANFPDQPDLLYFLAENARSTRQNDRAQAYANRLVVAFGKRTKPEGVSEADWEKKKSSMVGEGYRI